jgi:putative Ca2+/H+ antiporter (TMEM165/GDT1 family)
MFNALNILSFLGITAGILLMLAGMMVLVIGDDFARAFALKWAQLGAALWVLVFAIQAFMLFADRFPIQGG